MARACPERSEGCARNGLTGFRSDVGGLHLGVLRVSAVAVAALVLSAAKETETQKRGGHGGGNRPAGLSHGVLSSTTSGPLGDRQKRFRMLGGDPQENLRGPFGLAPSLLPVLEGIHADAEERRELRLGQPEMAP